MMRLAVVIAIVFGTVACGGDERAPHSQTSALATDGAPRGDERESPVAPRARGKGVLGFLWDDERTSLARLDRRTLRPLAGRTVEVPGSGAHAFSPDGRTLAIGRGETPGLQLVDVGALRPLGKGLTLPGAGYVGEILWADRERLVALVAGEDSELVTIDARERRIVSSRPLDGIVVASDTKAGRLALLLGPVGSIGPARLALVEADGTIDTVPLPEIRAGFEQIEDAEEGYTARERTPGLALSPDGARAVVVSAGGTVAEVDVAAERVFYHELAQPVSLLGRVRNWLEPEAEAKVIEGPSRFARWFGEHHVAVTGLDYHGVEDSETRATPAGLRLIDTRTWSIRTLAEQATGIVVKHGLLLAFGGPYAEGPRGRGIGLRAYGPGGEERFHAFGDVLIGSVETAWPYGYVSNDARSFMVLDLRSGRVVERRKTAVETAIIGP